jgi:hypothetical protein
VRRVLKEDPNIICRKMMKAPALTESDKLLRIEYARKNMSTNWNTVRKIGWIISIDCRHHLWYTVPHLFKVRSDYLE